MGRIGRREEEEVGRIGRREEEVSPRLVLLIDFEG